jgi:hypothetical protein
MVGLNVAVPLERARVPSDWMVVQELRQASVSSGCVSSLASSRVTLTVGLMFSMAVPPEFTATTRKFPELAENALPAIFVLMTPLIAVPGVVVDSNALKRPIWVEQGVQNRW